jgi:diguanylate cyclase (GGDEF)-like protein
MENRHQFEAQVKNLLATGIERFAVTLIDIDNFNRINEFYGRAVADAFLVQAGARVTRRIGPSDILARLDGDAFLLAITQFQSDDDLADAINALSQALREPFIVEGLEIFSSASIGVSLYPRHGRDVQALLENAELAMRQVKQSGKDGAAIYETAISQSASARAQAEQRLRQAIHDRRFRCAYQPKVDMATEEVTGVETLVRMIGDDGEVHNPGSFIALALELGLIDDLTLLIVHEIIDSIDLINEAFGPKTTISFNIAAKQASDVDFMKTVVAVLRESGFADRLIVEVTEEAFLAKSLFQTKVLPMLREIGARVSIDDFGTGYSSLSTLADITADELKIDRSFITDIHRRPRSQVVLKAIESLGAALNMSVVAEGVETLEELLYLKTATRIRSVQGYYFAKPMLLEPSTPLRGRNDARDSDARRYDGRKPFEIRSAAGRKQRSR